MYDPCVALCRGCNVKTVRLYGELAKKFGKEFRFDVKTPAEAVRAMCVTVRGFEAYIRQHKDDAFKVFAAGRNISESLCDPTSDNEVIRIAPVIQGASAVGRIVLGAVLLVFAWWNPYSWTTAAQMMAGLGASMVLGGISQLLSPMPKTSSGSGESVENTPSYNFNGPVNTTAQGHPVPLAYGRIMTGSAVISAGYTTR